MSPAGRTFFVPGGRATLGVPLNARGVVLLLLAWAPAVWAQDGRGASRLEVGERFCFRNAACLTAVRRDVAENRPIQWVIYTLSQAHYADDPNNAELAYDAAIRALVFANDFLLDAELQAGQTDYSGGNAAALRQIFARYSVACDNKRHWIARHHCLVRALFPLLPDQFHPELVPVGPEHNDG